jgi:hypothetical protein
MLIYICYKECRYVAVSQFIPFVCVCVCVFGGGGTCLVETMSWNWEETETTCTVQQWRWSTVFMTVYTLLLAHGVRIQTIGWAIHALKTLEIYISDKLMVVNTLIFLFIF